MATINKDALLAATERSTSELLYTVITDVYNEFMDVFPTLDADKVLNVANKVITKYVEEGIKMRKKPAPRAKTTVKPAKPKTLDLFTAAQQKKSSQLTISNWILHPENNKYSFAKIDFPSGYPIRDNATKKLVGIITNEDTHAPTEEDKKYAVMYSLEVDSNAELFTNSEE